MTGPRSGGAGRAARILWAVVLAVTACRSNPQDNPGRSGPPSLILIGLDGYRWDYLERPQARTLRAMAAQGVRADKIVPSFPSTTFTNAYTLVTGLYPDHHGIIGNKMLDRTDGARFAVRDSAAVSDPRWWGGEPIWTTALKHGRRAVVTQWAGSRAPVGGLLPENEPGLAGPAPNLDRVRQVIQWLSLPVEERPAVIAMFLLDVDQAGHRAGPDSPEADDAIARVDEELARLREELRKAGLDGYVNLVVVADHGMTALDPSRQIFLDDYLPKGGYEIIEASPVGGLMSRAGSDSALYLALAGRNPHLGVYLADQLPARWHHNHPTRTPPIILVADEGWFITERPGARRLGGDHGFDPSFPSMAGVFVALGPAFRRGVRVPAFQNVHLYGLLAAALGFDPAPNDGSLDSVSAILAPRAP